MTIKKEIVYPIFLECCQYANDIFWENIFEDLAYGKAPYGTYISKDFLCCSYKKKEFSYKIQKKESQKIYTEIYNLLTKKLGLFSQRENALKKQDFDTMEDNIKDSRKDWGDIRKKNIKELLIELYIIRMKKEHLLSFKQAKYLMSVIFIAMVFRVITSNDIDYSNGVINHINGIDFDKRKIIIKRDLYNLEVSFAPHIVLDKKIMSENWEKYLRDLRKLAN